MAFKFDGRNILVTGALFGIQRHNNIQMLYHSYKRTSLRFISVASTQVL